MRLAICAVSLVVSCLAACGSAVGSDGSTSPDSGRAIGDKTVTAPRTYEIGEQVPAKRVAVMNLKVTGRYSDQVKDWLPALIEDRLLREGWTLIVRGERMRHIQDERNLPGIKPETKLPQQELLGATAFIELNARIQVKDIQGLIGYKIFQFGDFARASVDLNGQVVDPATGVLKSSISVGGSASGLKTALIVSIGRDWRIGAGGYNLRGLRETLVGKAADRAAGRFLDRLKSLYPTIPAQRPAPALQPSSTTVAVEAAEPTILMTLPDTASAKVGNAYGIYRGDNLIAEVEILRVVGKRAEAKIISQTAPIRPTDKARRMPIILSEE